MPKPAGPFYFFQGTRGFSRYNDHAVLNIITSQVRALARNRIGYAVFSGVKAAATSFAKTLYVHRLQTTGLMFAAFTLMGGTAMFRLYRAHAWTGDPRRFWITLTFTSVCFGFTIMSFWKAKRRSA
jgi:hypothetical protein